MCFIFVKRGTRIRKNIAVSAMLISVLYLGFAVSNKISLEKKVDTYFTRSNLYYSRILTSPLPITNFVWLIVVEDEDGFYSANYSRKNSKIYYKRYFVKNHNLAKNFENDAEYQRLVRFSKGYYCLATADNGDIIFYDLRFASFDFDGTSDLDKAVFTHRLRQTDDGKLQIIHTYPKRKINWERLKRYYRQATGDSEQEKD
jgi:inner membrane protein